MKPSAKRLSAEVGERCLGTDLQKRMDLWFRLCLLGLRDGGIFRRFVSSLSEHKAFQLLQNVLWTLEDRKKYVRGLAAGWMASWLASSYSEIAKNSACYFILNSGCCLQNR